MAESTRTDSRSGAVKPIITKDSMNVDAPDEEIGKSVTISTNSQDFVEDGTITALGYAPAYRRVLGAFVGFCVVLSLTSPLGAILVSGHYQVYYAGYWGLSWGWIIPNFMMLPLVLAMCELCSSMPVNAGSYWWAAALAPRRLSRPIAFITGWFNVLALSTSLAAFAYAVAAGLTENISILTEDVVFTNAQVMGVSIGVITLWAGLMLLRLENISIVMIVAATFLVLSSFGFIIALPITHAQLGLPFTPAADVFGSFKNYSSWDQTGIAVSLSFYSVLFVNTVWMSPAYVAEETHNARVETPRAMLHSFIATAVVGMGICLALAFCINDMDVIANDPRGYPLFAALFENWSKSKAAPFLYTASAFSMIGGSGMILTYSTQVAAFARDRGLPYSDQLGRVDSRTNMPMHAAALLVVLAYLFLLPALSSNASDVIYAMATLCNTIIWLIPLTLRLFAGERWVPGPFSLGRWSWPTHCLGVLFSIYFLVTRCFPPDKDTPPIQVVVLLIVMTIAVVSYFVGGKKFHGLDLDAVESWRQLSRHSDEGADFVRIVGQSTA
ncbi:amino acid permease-domain-containing protein [Diaporthe sp. PMI_573]|nr:amino acid permease-domain-containing protein [Diaporthaceae sp. PMI_573]